LLGTEIMDFKCNHCKTEINIQDEELFNLYEEGLHDIECPNCEKTIYVNSIATFEFEVCDEDGDQIWDDD